MIISNSSKHFKQSPDIETTTYILPVYMVTEEASYLNPVMSPVAWVAGIWLVALDLHLSHRGVKAERNWNYFTSKPQSLFQKNQMLQQQGIFIESDHDVDANAALSKDKI